ncbi:MAG: hypothetical protein JNK14_01155 [Chitinophagaceae bacterium]|nr:hypothetical protein [Chitinophagaceae bacterium]
MNELDKRENTIAIDVELNEGERTLLSSNESGMRSPSLDLAANHCQQEDALLQELAHILAEAIIWQETHGNSNSH